MFGCYDYLMLRAAKWLQSKWHKAGCVGRENGFQL